MRFAELDEDRVLRVWTPILLRAILLVSVTILVAGSVLMATYAPDYYVKRIEAVREGNLLPPETFAQIIDGAARGDPHDVATLGLFVLTLVPLGRVAFCFLFFLAARDWMYVGFTGYVLAGLVLGVLLGRVG